MFTMGCFQTLPTQYKLYWLKRMRKRMWRNLRTIRLMSSVKPCQNMHRLRQKRLKRSIRRR